MIDEDVRAAILAPIDDSVGIDGREDEGEAGELLREIRSQRKALVRQEQALAMDESVAIDESLSWDAVADEASDYLSRYAKDLEPMAALVEASVRQDGAPGLAQAMALLADLVEAFWEQGLFPAEDEDGVETRFQPLSGLSGGASDRDGALILPVRRMPLVEFGGSVLAYVDKVKADALIIAAQSGDSDQRAARAEEAEAVNLEIETLALRIPRNMLEAAAKEVADAETDWRRAIAYIFERTKPRFPAASKLSDELQAIREWLASLIAKLPEPIHDADGADGDGVAADGASGVSAGSAPGSAVLSGRISRREDALRAVSMAADYFVTHEPLSPIGVTLREVDRRARMSLHDYLSELIPDESARDDFYWRSGIRPPAQSGYE